MTDASTATKSQHLDAKTRARPAKLGDLESLYAAIVDEVADSLSELIFPLEKKIAALEKKIAELEQCSKGFVYRGTWQPSTIYHVNDTITHQGSLWICLASNSARPGTGDDWRLAIKGGRK